MYENYFFIILIYQSTKYFFKYLYLGKDHLYFGIYDLGIINTAIRLNFDVGQSLVTTSYLLLNYIFWHKNGSIGLFKDIFLAFIRCTVKRGIVGREI